MDADGEVLASPQERSVAGLTRTLGVVTNYLDLKAKADGGDRSVTNDLFLAEIQLGKLGFEEAKTRSGDLKGLSDAERKLIQTELVNLEVTELFGRFQTRQMNPEAIAARFVEMAGENSIPTGTYAPSFWSFVIQFADQNKDAKLFEEGLTALKGLIGEEAQYAPMLEQMEMRLKQLKDG